MALDFSIIPWSNSITDYDMISKMRSNLYRSRMINPSVDVDIYLRAILIPAKANHDAVLQRFKDLLIVHPCLPKVIHYFFSESSEQGALPTKRLMLVHHAYLEGPVEEVEFLENCHSMDETSIASILKQTLNLLIALHKSQTDWCDLRPANILARKGQVSINLFSPRSISRFISRDSLPFLAPELARGQAPQHAFKGDIWSFGMTALHLISGPEIKDFTASETQKHPPIPSVCSSELQSVLSMCLDLDPARRPTPEELITLPFFSKVRTSEGDSGVLKRRTASYSDDQLQPDQTVCLPRSNSHRQITPIGEVNSLAQSDFIVRTAEKIVISPKHNSKEQIDMDVLLSSTQGYRQHDQLPRNRTTNDRVPSIAFGIASSGGTISTVTGHPPSPRESTSLINRPPSPRTNPDISISSTDRQAAQEGGLSLSAGRKHSLHTHPGGPGVSQTAPTPGERSHPVAIPQSTSGAHPHHTLEGETAHAGRHPSPRRNTPSPRPYGASPRKVSPRTELEKSSRPRKDSPKKQPQQNPPPPEPNPNSPPTHFRNANLFSGSGQLNSLFAVAASSTSDSEPQAASREVSPAGTPGTQSPLKHSTPSLSKGIAPTTGTILTPFDSSDALSSGSPPHGHHHDHHSSHHNHHGHTPPSGSSSSHGHYHSHHANTPGSPIHTSGGQQPLLNSSGGGSSTSEPPAPMIKVSPSSPLSIFEPRASERNSEWENEIPILQKRVEPFPDSVTAENELVANKSKMERSSRKKSKKSKRSKKKDKTRNNNQTTTTEETSTTRHHRHQHKSHNNHHEELDAHDDHEEDQHTNEDDQHTNEEDQHTEEDHNDHYSGPSLSASAWVGQHDILESTRGYSLSHSQQQLLRATSSQKAQLPHRAPMDLSRISFRMKLDRLGDQLDTRQPDAYFRPSSIGKNHCCFEADLLITSIIEGRDPERVFITGSPANFLPIGIAVADDHDQYLLSISALPSTKISSWIDGDTLTLQGELPVINFDADFTLIEPAGSRDFKRSIKFPTLISPYVKEPIMDQATHTLHYRIKKLIPTQMQRLVL